MVTRGQHVITSQSTGTIGSNHTRRRSSEWQSSGSFSSTCFPGGGVDTSAVVRRSGIRVRTNCNHTNLTAPARTSLPKTLLCFTLLGHKNCRPITFQVVCDHAQPQPHLVRLESVATHPGVIFTACLPSLIHCSAVPRLFVEPRHHPGSVSPDWSRCTRHLCPSIVATRLPAPGKVERAPNAR
jgi:hypothetical protein